MNLKIKILIGVAVLLLVLAGVYVAGNFIIPGNIKSNYQSKNCEQVLALDGFYASAYPAFMTDKSISDLTKECALYSVALESEQQKAWQPAYNAYKTYKQTYPKGLFASEADEHSAQILINWAKDQLAAKQYTDAIGNIELVLKSFGSTNAASESSRLMADVYIAWAKDQLAAKQYTDAIGNIELVLKSFGSTNAASEAARLMADVYTAWAKDQRETSDFAGAETTLKTFSAWADGAKKGEYVKSAQRELAQTYLAWGLSLESAQQVEDAKVKFDLATSTDPEPSVKTGPAMQAKTAQVQLYVQRGDVLVAKNDVAGAIASYQTAMSLSDEKDQPAIKDQIAAAHLKLAEKLTGKEDFFGALKEIEQAKIIAASDTAKTGIETAQTATYQAFSQSTGEQAQQAIADAAEKICSNERPELPIFGLDANSIHAYLFPKGAGRLTDTVSANTPASLYYVVCATSSTKSETKKTAQGKYVGGQWHPAPSSNIIMERITNYLDIKLYDLKTGKMITSQLFQGKAPTSWDAIYAYIRNNYVDADHISFVGGDPTPEVISEWVAKYIK